MKQLYFLIALSFAISVSSCKKNGIEPENQVVVVPESTRLAVYPNWPESFNSGTKTSYTAANVTLTTGSWNLNDAILGSSSSDRKVGTQSVRIQNSGTITMNFNLSLGASAVSISHAKYGTDANSTWSLWSSTNNGVNWTQVGSTISTTSTTLQTANFTISISGAVRFQLRKLSGGRLNIDNFSISDNDLNGTTRDDNLAFGNPSSAFTNVGAPNNYLLSKAQYALSYNNSRGTANWVSWHLSSAWKGAATRCNCFTQDASLPTSFFRATTSNYTNSGFDRGHLCPSEDRDGSSTDNAATFLMTNIIPQAPINNQQTWQNFEAYCQGLATSNQEMYIIAGGYGTGGSGSLGGVTNTINNGTITVPNRVWKVVVILTNGSDDLTRVSTTTRVIAIDTPNNQTANSLPWGNYRTTVDAIEAATGLDLLSNLPDGIEAGLESQVDSGPTI